VKLSDPVEEGDIVFRQAPQGFDVGHPEADSNEARLSRAWSPIEVDDWPARMQRTVVDARLFQDQMPAAPRTSFPRSAVQSGPEKLGGHLPIECGGGPDELIDCGERPRDVLRRKAVAQPLTSVNQLAIQHLNN